MDQIRTSDRIYQFLFLKTQLPIPTKENNGRPANWKDLVNQKISETDKEYLRLLDSRCPEIQHFFGWRPENGCFLSLGNSKNKEFKCFQQERLDKYIYTGIVFGKFDVLRLFCVPHPYWANIYKTLLLGPIKNAPYPIFSETLSVPTQKIILSERDIIDKKEHSAPYICITFINLPKLKKHSMDRPTIINTFWSEFKKARSKKTLKNSELFLTFSKQYPLLIKNEFNSLNELSNFHNHIRGLCDDISTIVTLNPNYYNHDQLNESILFSILCKISHPKKSTEIKTIKQEILSSLQEISSDPSKIKMYSSGFYWNLMISLKTKNPFLLLDTVINKIRKINSITKTATIPYWEDIKCPGTETHSPWVQFLDDLSLSQRPIHNVEDVWTQSLSKVPLGKPINKKSSSYDILNMRIYNLKFDLEWIYGYLYRLHTAWKAENLDEDIDTFNKLNEIAIDYLNKLSDLIIEFDKKANMLSEAQSKFMHIDDSLRVLEKKSRALIDDATIDRRKSLLIDGLMRCKGKIDNFHKKTEGTWKKLLKIEKGVSALKDYTSAVLSNFNEKLEGKQIVTATEPYLRFGDRAEIFDQIFESFNVLFRDYCGNLKDEWKGLVLPSFNSNFSICAGVRILFLPTDIKIHVHDKLLPLAHEAGHFLLNQLKYKDDARNAFIKEIWEPLHDDAIKHVKKLSLQFDADRDHKQALNETIKSIQTEIEKEKNNENKKTYRSSELFADLIAGLSAGPGYFRSLGLVAFKPSSSVSSDGHPPVWLRIFLGLTLYENNFIPCHENWIKDINDGFINIKKTHLSIDSWIDYLKKDEFISNLSIKYAISSKSRQPENEISFTPTFYIIKALLSDKKHIRSLINWANKHFGDDFLFFPYKDDKSDIELVYESKKIYNKCKKIAENLLYDQHLILYEKPKNIAAASVLKPIKRPVYPSGRILHSIYYSQFNTDPIC